jgi:hypothetical protein
VILRCPICGDDFQPRNYRVRCCSSACGDKFYYQENRAEIIARASERKSTPGHRSRERHRDYMRDYMRDYRRRKSVVQS